MNLIIEARQSLEVVETLEGILLKSKASIAGTCLEDLAGSLSYEGPTISLDEMEQAIEKGVKDHNDRR